MMVADLTGTYTFTNASAIVQGNSSVPDKYNWQKLKWVISSLMTTEIR